MFWEILGALVAFVFFLAIPIPMIAGIIGYLAFGWVGAMVFSSVFVMMLDDLV